MNIKKLFAHTFYLESILVLLLKVTAAAAVFFVTFIIARFLNSEQAGLFFLGFTILIVMATIARFGLENTVVRFMSRFQLKSQWRLLEGVYRISLCWVLVFSLLLSLILWFGAEIISESIFSRQSLTPVLKIMAIALPVVNVMMMHGQYLLGLGRVVFSTIALNFGWAICFLFIVFFFDIDNAQEASVVYLFSIAVATAVAIFSWKKVTQPTQSRYLDKRFILASSLPLWLVQIISLINVWIPPLLLGYWFQPEQVATFHVVLRIAMLISFAMVAVNAVVAPRFSEMYAQNNSLELKQLAKKSTLLLFIVSLPIFVVVVVAPEFILGLFGENYKEAVQPLRLLACAELITGTLGSVGFLLIMSGNEKVLRNNLIIAGGLSLVAALVLIPTIGLLGAVIATGVGNAGSNMLSAWAVRQKLGFWPAPTLKVNAVQ